MILNLSRLAAAALAAVFLVSLHARPAEAAVGCGAIQCAVQVTADPGSGIGIMDDGSDLIYKHLYWGYFPLDDVPVALMGPGVSRDRVVISRCQRTARTELSIETHRAAGNVAEVSITARLYAGCDDGPLADTQTVRPVVTAIAPGQTVERSFMLHSELYDTDYAMGKLVLSNRLVPFAG